MTKTFTTTKGEYLLVEVPGDAHNFRSFKIKNASALAYNVLSHVMTEYQYIKNRNDYAIDTPLNWLLLKKI